MDEELERFKRDVAIPAYASSIGFVINKRKSSRASMVMQRGSEKIIISRKADGVFTYWSPENDQSRGTVIDLAQRETGLNLGGVRRLLRVFSNAPSPPLSFTELKSSVKDFDAVTRRFNLMRVAHRHPYLAARGITEETLRHPRFNGTVRIDRYGAAIFPHKNVAGDLTGYEIKNHGCRGSRTFTGYAPGGRKEIWMSNVRSDDVRIVIAESAIDAISHSTIFDDPGARYASVSGKMTEAQHATLRAAIIAMPPNSEIVAASDADPSGDALGQMIANMVRASGRLDLRFRRDRPGGGKDFNEMLQRRLDLRLPDQRLDLK